MTEVAPLHDLHQVGSQGYWSVLIWLLGMCSLSNQNYRDSGGASGALVMQVKVRRIGGGVKSAGLEMCGEGGERVMVGMELETNLLKNRFSPSDS